jgi:rubrerythrin
MDALSKTGLVPGSVSSLDELLAVAHAMEQEAAARYRALSSFMHRQGDAEMAAQFETLAHVEDRHVMDVAGRSELLLGHAPNPVRVCWVFPANFDEALADGTMLSVYQALAYAVRNEERAFAFYTYVAAEADRPDIRALAEDLARDEIHHATMLRHYRRRAFHTERPAPLDIPETVGALRAMSRRWDAEAAAAHAILATTLEAAGEADDAANFRRLAAREAEAASGAEANSISALRSAADGLRLVEAAFNRYALIGERAIDEAVLIETQSMAGEIVARLALFGEERQDTMHRWEEA